MRYLRNDKLDESAIMKIIHIIDVFTPGGKERRLLELVKEMLNYSNIENHVVVLSDQIHYEELRKLPIKLKLIDRKSIGNIKTFFVLYKYCKANKPDIIHSWAAYVSLYSSVISKLLSVKFVNGMIASAPDLKFFSKLWLYAKTTFPFSDIILSNSQAGINAFRAPLKKSQCIHNGFYFGRISNLESTESVRSRLKIQTRFIVGMIASFSVYKDYSTYIKSAGLVLEKHNDITFLCVGQGVQDKYISMAAGYKPDRFLFLSNQKDVEAIMNICDIGVLSTYSEGISNSIMEFMALGKPVIATGKGGTKEIINDGVTGYILPQGDHVKMAEKINELIDDPELRGRMGKASYNTIKEKFGIERMCSEIYAVYDKLLTGKK